MPDKMSSGFCKTCEKQSAIVKAGTNHILHLLLTVLCCGWWLPLWALITISNASNDYKCSSCGLPVKKQDNELTIGFVLLALTGILILFAMFGMK